MKRIFIKYTLGILLIFSTQIILAQDIHFSQYYFSPLNFNPAAAGDFSSTVRFTNNYKTQWSTISSNPYKTISTSIDANIYKDKLGAGLMFYSDKAGDAKMGTTQIGIPIATKVQINEKNSLRFGIMAAFAQHSIDITNVTWDSQYNGSTFDKSLSNGEAVQPSSYNYFDMSSGFVWRYIKSENLQMYTSVSALHLTTPKQSYYATDPLKVRWVFNYGLKIKFGEKNNVLLPNLLIMKQGGAYEITPGAMYKFEVGKQALATNSDFYAGAYFRMNDGIITTFRVDYKNSLQIGMSYDFTLSSLSPSAKNRGGFELSLLFYLHKKAEGKSAPSF